MYPVGIQRWRRNFAFPTFWKRSTVPQWSHQSGQTRMTPPQLPMSTYKNSTLSVFRVCALASPVILFYAEFYVTSWLENPFSGELDRDDIELLLHFFWLPHSHGPKAQITLNYFKQLLEDAHIIQKLGLYNKRDGEMVDEPHGYKNLSNETNYIHNRRWQKIPPTLCPDFALK